MMPSFYDGFKYIKDPADKSAFYTIDPSTFSNFPMSSYDPGVMEITDEQREEIYNMKYTSVLPPPLTETELINAGKMSQPCACDYPEYKLKLMKHRINFFLLKNPKYKETHYTEGYRVCCLFNNLKFKGLIK